MASTIYGLCGSNGEIRYIGQTKCALATRLAGHVSSAKVGRDTPRKAWVREQHSAGNLQIVMLSTADDADAAEAAAITEWRGKGHALFNISPGGRENDFRSRHARGHLGPTLKFRRGCTLETQEPIHRPSTPCDHMTPQDFKDWMSAMGFKSLAQAAEALGVSVETVANWVNGKRRDGKPAPIDERTALACSALYHRLKPWGQR
jgi:hypothetical protein